MNVLRLELRQNAKSALIWTIIGMVVSGGFLCLFPSMTQGDTGKFMEEILASMPQEFLKVFNLAALPNFSQIDQFFAYVFQYMVLASSIFAAWLGANSLVREETDGTIEFLFAQPVTRSGILMGKMCANGLLFLGYLVCVYAASAAGIYAFLPNRHSFVGIMEHITLIFIALLLTGYLFMAMGFFISALVKGGRPAAPLALGVVFFTYILGIVSKLVKSLDWLFYASPVHYATPADILVQRDLNATATIIGGGLLILFVALSFVWYAYKDFHTT